MLHHRGGGGGGGRGGREREPEYQVREKKCDNHNYKCHAVGRWISNGAVVYFIMHF